MFSSSLKKGMLHARVSPYRKRYEMVSGRYYPRSLYFPHKKMHVSIKAERKKKRYDTCGCLFVIASYNYFEKCVRLRFLSRVAYA